MIIHVVVRNRLDINKVNNIFLKDEKQPEVVKIICVILTLKHDIKSFFVSQIFNHFKS